MVPSGPEFACQNATGTGASAAAADPPLPRGAIQPSSARPPAAPKARLRNVRRPIRVTSSRAIDEQILLRAGDILPAEEETLPGQ